MSTMNAPKTSVLLMCSLLAKRPTFHGAIRCMAISAAPSNDTGVTLVWPPPYGLTEMIGGDQNGSPEKEDRERVESGSAASTSSQDSQASELRKNAVANIFHAYGLGQATFARTNLQKLPVKVLRAELQNWGYETLGKAKPILIEQMHSMLNAEKTEESSGNASSSSRLPAMERMEARRAVSQEYDPVKLLDMFTPEQLADWLLEAKTDAVQVLDVRGVCEFADYFVLATGRSHQHVHSAASGVCWQISQKAEHLLKGRALFVEGGEGSDWITVDAGKTVVHVFTEEARREYNLEALWERGRAGIDLAMAEEEQQMAL